MGVWNEMRKRSLGLAAKEEEKVKPEFFDSSLDGQIIWTGNPSTDINDIFKIQRKTLKETEVSIKKLCKELNDFVWYKDGKCDYLKNL